MSSDSHFLGIAAPPTTRTRVSQSLCDAQSTEHRLWRRRASGVLAGAASGHNVTAWRASAQRTAYTHTRHAAEVPKKKCKAEATQQRQRFCFSEPDLRSPPLLSAVKTVLQRVGGTLHQIPTVGPWCSFRPTVMVNSKLESYGGQRFFFGGTFTLLESPNTVTFADRQTHTGPFAL